MAALFYNLCPGAAFFCFVEDYGCVDFIPMMKCYLFLNEWFHHGEWRWLWWVMMVLHWCVDTGDFTWYTNTIGICICVCACICHMVVCYDGASLMSGGVW